MKVTKHARRRMRERCGIGKKSCDRMAQTALSRGISTREATGQLKRFMDGLYFYNRTANNIRIYGGKAWIFHNSSLITVLNVPPQFMDQANTQIKKKRKIQNT